jgi:hypothetical protein
LVEQPDGGDHWNVVRGEMIEPLQLELNVFGRPPRTIQAENEAPFVRFDQVGIIQTPAQEF